MAPLTPKEVGERYGALDYAIRYLEWETPPRAEPEPGAVFALEYEAGALVSDPVGAALLFATEAQAFAYRQRVGLLHPVLVFYAVGYAPEREDYDADRHGVLSDSERIDAYVDGGEQGT